MKAYGHITPIKFYSISHMKNHLTFFLVDRRYDFRKLNLPRKNPAALFHLHYLVSWNIFVLVLHMREIIINGTCIDWFDWLPIMLFIRFVFFSYQMVKYFVFLLNIRLIPSILNIKIEKPIIPYLKYSSQHIWYAIWK
jgi:hypothetical protein